MKKFIVVICFTMLAACTDSVDLSSIHDRPTLNDQNVQAMSGIVVPVGSYQWTKLSTTQPGVNINLLYGPRAYPIGETAFVNAGSSGQNFFKLSSVKHGNILPQARSEKL